MATNPTPEDIDRMLKAFYKFQRTESNEDDAFIFFVKAACDEKTRNDKIATRCPHPWDQVTVTGFTAFCNKCKTNIKP